MANPSRRIPNGISVLPVCEVSTLPCREKAYLDPDKWCEVCKGSTRPDVRDIDTARREALDAVTRYVELSRAWNAPDDEHTRWQARRLVDDAIQDVMYDLAPEGFHDEH